MKKILLSGNSLAQMNYILVKHFRKKTNYKADLLLQSYNSPIHGHPAWEDIPIKIPQNIIQYDPKKALEIFNDAILENNWKMPFWVKENPIHYSIIDKFLTKYFDKFHTTKKQINHHISDMKSYDFVLADGFSGISAMLSKTPFAIRPFGTDIDVMPFEKNFRGKMVRKAFQKCKAVCMYTTIPSLYDLGLEEKFVQISYVIDTVQMSPSEKKSSNQIDFFLASRLDFKLKGTDKVLKAFSRLLQKYDAHLFCLEFGSDVKQTKELLIQLGIEKNVTIYDFVVSKPVLKELFNKSDAVIADLKRGIIGTTGFEAMACEKPVIGFSKIENLLEKEMPILNSFSEDEIYKNMIRICEKNDIPKGMRNFVIENFSFEKFLNKFEKFLE